MSTEYTLKSALLISLLLTCIIYNTAAIAAKLIPSVKEYNSFLLYDWQPDRLNVLIFKDPFCPYCIRAIPKLKNLKNDYNVFIFWLPVFGQKSDTRIDDIFRCTRPVSPSVLKTVQNRQQPDCQGDINLENKKLNKIVVDNYDISGVPSYYLQGKNVSLTTLLARRQYSPPINGVVVDWQRFSLMKINNSSINKSLALIIPKSHGDEVKQLVTKNQPEYLFLENDLIQEFTQLLHCEKGKPHCLKQQSQQYKKRLAEFKLLFTDSLPKDQVLLIDNNGIVVEI